MSSRPGVDEFREATRELDIATRGRYAQLRPRVGLGAGMVAGVAIGQAVWWVSPALATTLACCITGFSLWEAWHRNRQVNRLAQATLTELSLVEVLHSVEVWNRLAVRRGLWALDCSVVILGADFLPTLNNLFRFLDAADEPNLHFVINLCIFINLGLFQAWRTRTPVVKLLTLLDARAKALTRMAYKPIE